MNQIHETPAKMKSITIRKAGSVRLTSAAHPLYAGGCKPVLA
jgi:hypothetical protein